MPGELIIDIGITALFAINRHLTHRIGRTCIGLCHRLSRLWLKTRDNGGTSAMFRERTRLAPLNLTVEQEPLIKTQFGHTV